jgi:dihydropteroate synthase
VQRLQAFQSVLSNAAGPNGPGAAILGVCNVTPDSFSDGGKAFGFDAAMVHIESLLAQGAHMIDIGAESTRPRAAPVSPREQIVRMVEVVRAASARCFVSVDTTQPEVLEVCMQAGAHAVNDVSCGKDPRLAQIAAKYGAVYILMHARGSQTQMTGFSEYPDAGYQNIVSDVTREWTLAKESLIRQGVGTDAIVFDPGYGFAKNANQSLELLRRTEELVSALPFPLLSGASRKSFLKFTDPSAKPEQRVGASVAAAAYAVRHGAKMVRVHDVREVAQALFLEHRLRARELGASLQAEPC